MTIAPTPIGEAASRRERHRAAVRAAMMRVGLSCSALAHLVGVGEKLVEAWVRANAPNHFPAWALDHLRAARADFAAALDHELSGSLELVRELDDTTALRVVRLYAEASAVIASPARHTPDGASRALALTARIEGEHRTVVRALRDVAEARRAA